METTNYCQSCGMPMGNTDEMYGLNADGTKSADYCKYCFENGSFTSDQTMEQMIETCVPFMVKEGMEEQKARSILVEQFPNLKRWKK